MLLAIGAYVVGAIVGSHVPIWGCWTVVFAVVAATVILKVKLDWEPRVAATASFIVAIIIAVLNQSMVADEQRARIDAATRSEAAAAAHQKEAICNHDRRLAWNLAHPIEVARLRAQAKSKMEAQILAGRQRAAAIKLADDRKAAAEKLANAASERRAAANESAQAERQQHIDTEASRFCNSLTEAASYVKSCKVSSGDDAQMDVKIDSDDYVALTEQDKKLFRAYFFSKWYKMWRADHPDQNASAADVKMN